MPPHTHHNQGRFHAKDGIDLCEQRRRELVETGSVGRHAKVIRAGVVSPQCQKELTQRALFFVSTTEEQKKNTT